MRVAEQVMQDAGMALNKAHAGNQWFGWDDGMVWPMASKTEAHDNQSKSLVGHAQSTLRPGSLPLPWVQALGCAPR